MEEKKVLSIEKENNVNETNSRENYQMDLGDIETTVKFIISLIVVITMLIAAPTESIKLHESAERICEWLLN